MGTFWLEIITSINNLLQTFGYWGLGISMFAESIGVPFTSSYFVATAGHLVMSGKLSLFKTVAVATSGITLGSSVSYGLGYYSTRLGRNACSRLFKKFPQAVHIENHAAGGNDRVLSLMQKYGTFSILIAQLFGFTRTFVSFPAGAMGVNFGQFLLFTALGGALFTCILLTGSVILARAIGYLSYLSSSLPIILIFLLFLAVFAYRRTHRAE